MTNEEKQLLLKDLCARLPYADDVVPHKNWLNEHHFDFRGLIPIYTKFPLRLALEAKEGMYK